MTSPLHAAEDLLAVIDDARTRVVILSMRVDALRHAQVISIRPAPVVAAEVEAPSGSIEPTAIVEQPPELVRALSEPPAALSDPPHASEPVDAAPAPPAAPPDDYETRSGRIAPVALQLSQETDEDDELQTILDDDAGDSEPIRATPTAHEPPPTTDDTSSIDDTGSFEQSASFEETDVAATIGLTGAAVVAAALDEPDEHDATRIAQPDEELLAALRGTTPSSPAAAQLEPDNPTFDPIAGDLDWGASEAESPFASEGLAAETSLLDDGGGGFDGSVLSADSWSDARGLGLDAASGDLPGAGIHDALDWGDSGASSNWAEDGLLESPSADSPDEESPTVDIGGATPPDAPPPSYVPAPDAWSVDPPDPAAILSRGVSLDAPTGEPSRLVQSPVPSPDAWSEDNVLSADAWSEDAAPNPDAWSVDRPVLNPDEGIDDDADASDSERTEDDDDDDWSDAPAPTDPGEAKTSSLAYSPPGLSVPRVVEPRAPDALIEPTGAAAIQILGVGRAQTLTPTLELGGAPDETDTASVSAIPDPTLVTGTGDGFALQFEEPDEPTGPHIPVLTDDDAPSQAPAILSADGLVSRQAVTPIQGDLTTDAVAEFLAAAEEAERTGDLRQAVVVYDDLLSYNPHHIRAHLGRGRCLVDLGDYGAAMSDFTRAEDLAPESADPLVEMGNLFFARKEYKRAVAYYSHAIDVDAGYAMAWSRRGICHYHRREYAEAHHDLTEAESRDPSIPGLQRYIQMAARKAKSRR